MGIGYREIILVINSLERYNKKKNVKICELGNNYFKGDKMMDWLKSNGFDFSIGGEQHNKGVVSKKFWNEIGFIHTSIDMNGLDGALNYDLRKDISNSFTEPFDVVYDGGTGEHVENQYMLFKNVHSITKVGGLMLHVLPKIGYFPNHCKYYYTMDSFRVLSDMCKYDVLELFEHDAEGGIMIYCTLKKSDNNYITEKEFERVPIHYVDEPSHDRNLYPYAYEKN